MVFSFIVLAINLVITKNSTNGIAWFHPIRSKGFILGLGLNICSSYVVFQVAKMRSQIFRPAWKNRDKVFKDSNSQHWRDRAHSMDNEHLHNWFMEIKVSSLIFSPQEHWDLIFKIRPQSFTCDKVKPE